MGCRGTWRTAAEKHADGDAVDADKDDAWDDEQRLPARPESVEERDHHIDQEIVGEDDKMAPDGLINVDAERRLQLLTDGPVGDEHIAAVEHELGDELPGDEAEGDKGKEARGSASHQRTIDEAQAEDERAEDDENGPSTERR